jgi:hypothetical protein
VEALELPESDLVDVDLAEVVKRPYGKTGQNVERARLSGFTPLPPARKMIRSY